MWHQKSRALWLNDGDRNTKFFHGKAKQNRKANHISKLKDDRGVWWRGEEQCENILIQHFKEILSTSQPSLHDIEEVVQVVNNTLSLEQKQWCVTPFTAGEFDEALAKMHPLRSRPR